MSLSQHFSLDLLLLNRSGVDEFRAPFNDPLRADDELVRQAKREVITPNERHLSDAYRDYHLDQLLLGMLDCAPHPRGKRYVAAVLLVVQARDIKRLSMLPRLGSTTCSSKVSIVCGSFYSSLHFFPLEVLSIYRRSKASPHNIQTPSYRSTLSRIEATTRSPQQTLRKKVALRENFRSAITGHFDLDRALALEKLGRTDEVPTGPGVMLFPMEAAHIIPFSFNKARDSTSTSTSLDENAPVWDILQLWTTLDPDTLRGQRINSPSNAIYLATHEYVSFGIFRTYLEAISDTENKYIAHKFGGVDTFLDGQTELPVEFQSIKDIEVPEPELLRIHAAFAKVLHVSGAAGYLDTFTNELEENGTLCPSGETDLEFLITTRLGVSTGSLVSGPDL